jgi:hypothetical protein
MDPVLSHFLYIAESSSYGYVEALGAVFVCLMMAHGKKAMGRKLNGEEVEP